MKLLLTLVMFSVLMKYPGLVKSISSDMKLSTNETKNAVTDNTTNESTVCGNETDNNMLNGNRTDDGVTCGNNTDYDVGSGNNTDANTSSMVTQSVSRGKRHGLVSTETKDLVLLVVNCGLLPVVCLFGIVGNIMSLVVLYVQGSQERTNVILVGLSLSDTLFLIMTVLRKVNCLVSKFDKNAAFDLNMIMQAQVMMLHILFGRLTSAMTMLISIERFIAVYFPLKAHFLLTPLRLKIAVGVLYGLICVAIAPLLGMYKISYIYSRRQQRVIPYPQLTQFYINNSEGLDIYLNNVLNVMFRYTPMFVVCVFTMMVIIRIKKSTSWRRKSSSNVAGIKEENRVTNMLLLVNCIYIVCLIPGAITITVRYFIDGFNFFGVYSNIFNLLGGIIILLEAINSSVNFIVYMAMSKKFAETYKRVFLCRRRRSHYTDNVATLNTVAGSVSTVSNTTV